MLNPCDDCSGAVHEERPQVNVAAFAHSQLPHAAACSGLVWHQAKPCGELWFGFIGHGIANGGNGCGCREQWVMRSREMQSGYGSYLRLRQTHPAAARRSLHRQDYKSYGPIGFVINGL